MGFCFIEFQQIENLGFIRKVRSSAGMTDHLKAELRIFLSC
ncbi:Uncharacterized protein dnm_062770 [Desulfonema magnum]|uniref:Uncharacterized protein n=1 Tax=Desulfonema magnum TaxID=45655 RepID=A0A975BRC1_9BACT|nr:Uncharacterized protein dnm_062770 [Desulfonema magnum]